MRRVPVLFNCMVAAPTVAMDQSRQGALASERAYRFKMGRLSTPARPRTHLCVAFQFSMHSTAQRSSGLGYASAMTQSLSSMAIMRAQT